MTKDDLIAFEAEVAERFNRGEIRAPVHLSGGNEDHLIDIFRDVRPGDYVFSTWRSHFHALLQGIPPDEVMAAIVTGRSISLNFPQQRFFSSAIVGGCLPIAVGVAMGVKLQYEKYKGTKLQTLVENVMPRIWVFVGDMAARTGVFHEATSYAQGHDLPITFVIEDNSLSVCTPTEEVWGDSWNQDHANVVRYKYHLNFPHAGAGVRVNF